MPSTVPDPPDLPANYPEDDRRDLILDLSVLATEGDELEGDPSRRQTSVQALEDNPADRGRDFGRGSTATERSPGLTRTKQASGGGRVLASKPLLERLDARDALDLGVDPTRLTYEVVAELEGASDKAVRDAGLLLPFLVEPPVADAGEVEAGYL